MQGNHFSEGAKPTGILRAPPLIPAEWEAALRRSIQESSANLAETYRRHAAFYGLTLSEPEPPSRRERAAAWVRARREALGKRIAPTLLTHDEASDAYGDW